MYLCVRLKEAGWGGFGACGHRSDAAQSFFLSFLLPVLSMTAVAGCLLLVVVTRLRGVVAL